LQKENNYLIITVGYPGSGKSHMSNILNKQYDIQIVNQDTCKTNSKCLKLCKQSIDANKSVIVDNTNPTREIRKKFIDLVSKKNYKIICLNFTTSMEISQHNNKFRNYITNNAVNKIPDVVYYTFRKKYEQPELDEGFNKIIDMPSVLNYKMPPEYFFYY
jgi:bifunctional polynucleotide phosphatase/kinase